VPGSKRYARKFVSAAGRVAPDFITFDTSDGGTGAAPSPLMENVGLPIKEVLLMVIDILSRHNLRKRIKAVAPGKLRTGHWSGVFQAWISLHAARLAHPAFHFFNLCPRPHLPE
jgi:glutamate synthase domain-containing protein 2